MVLYNLIGRRRFSVGAVSRKQRVNVLLLQFCAYIRFVVKILIETNVNISNELNFSDVYWCKLHCGVHSLCTRSSLVYENEIYSLNECLSNELNTHYNRRSKENLLGVCGVSSNFCPCVIPAAVTGSVAGV